VDVVVWQATVKVESGEYDCTICVVPGHRDVAGLVRELKRERDEALAMVGQA